MYWLQELFNMLRRCEEQINGNVYITISSGEHYIQLNTYWSEGYDWHKRIALPEISFARVEINGMFDLFINECNRHYREEIKKDKDDSQDLHTI